VAKKRVHEIAKQRGLTSKEVLAALNAAGVEATAAASSVEEEVALKALAANGGDGAQAESDAKAPAKSPPKPKAAGDGKPPQEEAPAKSGAADGEAAKAKQQPRPVRAEGGRPAARSGGKRRRVVIDSQASRREHMPQAPPRRPPRRRGGRRRRPLLEPPSEPTPVAEPDPTKVNSGATVQQVAETLDLGSPELIKKLMERGEMATLTQTLPDETIKMLADAFDRKVEIVSAAEEEVVEPEYEDSEEELEERPPVVTVMGHVDHGKTSLLDAIRETEVVAGEAGGITQHIGAYQVHQDDKAITFIDTPGHEAFTAMRARGAQVTDLAVIVVAADDGVMPQTVEAIDHARAAGVPIMVAVNKIDKQNAQPDKVRTELAGHDLNPEEWGGETVYADVSAKTKDGLDNLLQMIVLVSELEELKANPNAAASGTVVESQLDQGRGPVATVLVQRGTLNVGDAVVSGPQWGRVRAMHDYTGARVEEAVPGMPVEVLGFQGVPEAGDRVQVVENERQARQMAQERETRLKTEALARQEARKVTLEEVFAKAREGEIKELNIVLKADVQGSLEALRDEIAKLPQDQVTINIIRAAPGGINESDVMLAAASEAIVIGFNVRPGAEARRAADAEGIEIRTYSVIYKVTDELKAAMEGLLEPEEVEETLGEAEVKQLFRSSRWGTIAGSQVVDGKVTRNGKVRLVRDGTVVWTGRIASLRRFKDDVGEVEEGLECGIVLDGYQDVKEGDVLEVFETRQVEKTLE
jgi:translation initiation factor IF-2